MQSREDSLWESFPQAIKTREGAGRYINAFRAPFQGLLPLSYQDVYVLRACSLLVIPPPTGRVAPQGGFPTDLTGINLLDWAALVQDMMAGLQVLPPGLSNCLGPKVVNLLQLLEVATGVRFCHCCCNPEPHCRCVGVPQLAPPTSWSQILEQTPGYGTATSSAGVTTSEYLLGRYDWTGATSPRALHLEPVSGDGAYTLAAWHKPTLQASHWEGRLAKGHAE